MIYLACPYSDPDPMVRQFRFIYANKQAAIFMAEGLHVFSPISQCHPIALEGDLPVNWEYWKEYDEKILSICDELCILTIPGWLESKGVQNEYKIARKLNLKITVVTLGSIIRIEAKSKDIIDRMVSDRGNKMKKEFLTAITEIENEREKQDQKWGIQNHEPLKWLPILVEEVGELAKELCEITFDGKNTKKYRQELIQVAAVAVAMLESLERGNK